MPAKSAKSPIVNDVNQFNKRVDALGKLFDGKTVAIQGLLVSGLLFAVKSGNTMPCAYLFNGLGNVANRESIGVWFAKHGVRVSYSSTDRKYSAKAIKEKLAESKATFDADNEAAVNTWMSDLFTNIDKNKGRDFTGMSLDQAIAAAVKRYEASKAKHKDDPNVRFDDGLLAYWKEGLDRAAKRNKPTTNADGATLN